MRTFVGAAVIALSFVTSAQAAVVSAPGVPISRVAAGASGGTFLYIPPSVFTECNQSVWGITFSVLYIPNSNLYAMLLAAKNAGNSIRQLIVNDGAPATNVDWTATTTCRVDYADIE